MGSSNRFARWKMLSGLSGKKSAKAYYAVFSRYCSGDKGEVGAIKAHRRAGARFRGAC